MKLNKPSIAKKKKFNATLLSHRVLESGRVLCSATCKARDLTVSSGLAVRDKYLMAKPMGFADQCKPSFARPAPEERAPFAPFYCPRVGG